MPNHAFTLLRLAAFVASRSPLAIALVGLLALPAAAQVFGPGPSNSALFDTVINLPPAPNIGSGQSIGGDGQTTQVNLGDGGFINSSFDVLSGGELNVSGGRINSSLDVRSGGELNISGGLIGFTGQAFSGSQVTITGGLVDQSLRPWPTAWCCSGEAPSADGSGPGRTAGSRSSAGTTT